MPEFEFPADLRYTSDHEWVRVDGERARVGITSYAQDALGDIVFVTLPDEGSAVSAGQACGEVESTKSVSDVFSPLTGSVAAVNPALDSAPELVNSDPYGEGWMFEVTIDDLGAVSALLTAEQYREQIG